MSSFERICPQCGTGNTLDRTQCVKCRASLTGASAPPPPPPADLFSRRSMARLAWRMTKFFARTGFDLALGGARRGVDRVRQHGKHDVKHETIDGDIVPAESPTAPSSQPTRLNDWRVYSKPSAQNDAADSERISWSKKS